MPHYSGLHVYVHDTSTLFSPPRGCQLVGLQFGLQNSFKVFTWTFYTDSMFIEKMCVCQLLELLLLICEVKLSSLNIKDSSVSPHFKMFVFLPAISPRFTVFLPNMLCYFAFNSFLLFRSPFPARRTSTISPSTLTAVSYTHLDVYKRQVHIFVQSS